MNKQKKQARFNRYRCSPGICVHCKGELDEDWERFVPLFDSAWSRDAVTLNKERKVLVKHKIEEKGEVYYVKLYSKRYAGGLEQKLLRGSSLTFFTSKALKDMLISEQLLSLNVDVVAPSMVIDRRYGFIQQESMLISRESLLPPLGRCFRDEEQWRSYLPALENMISDIAVMHNNGYIQRDPHFNNVLVKDNLKVKWLDFGTIKRFRLNKKKAYIDLKKFWLKSVEMLTGRVSEPGEFAKDLMERNYPETDMLDAALREVAAPS